MPKILETPKDKAPSGDDWDTLNLGILRSLAEGKKLRLKQFATELELKAKGSKAKSKSPKAASHTHKSKRYDAGTGSGLQRATCAMWRRSSVGWQRDFVFSAASLIVTAAFGALSETKSMPAILCTGLCETRR